MTLLQGRSPLTFHMILALFLLGATTACGDSQDTSAPADTVQGEDAGNGADPMVDASGMNDVSDPQPDAGEMDAAADVVEGDVEDDAPDPTPDPTPEQPPEMGPIPPPEGADTTPEEEAFDWSGVGTEQIARSIPGSRLTLSDFPVVGVARLLDSSDSEECVCFDVECATCSQDSCGLQTCNYALNDSHTLTKYHVELRSLADERRVITFEVNVSFAPAINYTSITDVLRRLERIPVAYWRGLKIITKFGRGIQFLHGSYFNGAAAYGSRSYIDTQTAELPTLIHELGHTFEQYTRLGDEPALEPQSNILDPIWRHAIRSDDIRTSGYGNSNEWEDLAEFARLYATAIVEGRLADLQALSPERYRVWERILANGYFIEL